MNKLICVATIAVVLTWLLSGGPKNTEAIETLACDNAACECVDCQCIDCDCGVVTIDVAESVPVSFEAEAAPELSGETGELGEWKTSTASYGSYGNTAGFGSAGSTAYTARSFATQDYGSYGATGSHASSHRFPVLGAPLRLLSQVRQNSLARRSDRVQGRSAAFGW